MPRIFPTRAAIVAFAAVVALLGLCSPAQAAFKLKLTDSATATTVIVEDEMAGDSAAGVAGAITFVGSVGSFTTNIVIGASKPVLGTTTTSMMTLNDLSVKSTGGPSTLTIELTDTDFTIPADGPASLTSRFNAATVINATVTFQDFVANFPGAEFETTADTDPGQGSDNPSVYTNGVLTSSLAPASILFPLNQSYSLTQRITIMAGAGGSVVGSDASTTVEAVPVPEPASMLLGLLGGIPLLGGAWLRKRRALAAA